jgi:hypothetical protein
MTLAVLLIAWTTQIVIRVMYNGKTLRGGQR